MTNLLTTISITVALFFFFTTILLLFRNRADYKKKMEGTRELVNQTKKIRTERQQFFKESNALSSIEESKVDAIWLNEVIFYQNISEAICNGDEMQIKSLTEHVTKLIEPYCDIINDLTTIDMVEDEDINPSEVTAENFAKLEQRYQQKIDENTKLQKQVDILKKSPYSASSEGDDDNQSASSDLLIKVIQDCAQLTETEVPDLDKADPSELETICATIKAKLIEKMKSATNQPESLLEQLRSEKITNFKKYKRAMALLFNTYKEYASAFGLESPQDPNIEIDEFEEFIENN